MAAVRHRFAKWKGLRMVTVDNLAPFSLGLRKAALIPGASRSCDNDYGKATSLTDYQPHVFHCCFLFLSLGSNGFENSQPILCRNTRHTCVSRITLSFVCALSNPLANGLVNLSQFHYLCSLPANVRRDLAWPYHDGRDRLTCQTELRGANRPPGRKGIR